MHRYDIVVLGGGIGGYSCAIRASQLGKKVALVEEREMGGTCLNRGCIPTKALLRSAELYDLLTGSEEFGINAGKTSFNLGKMMQRKAVVVSKLRGGVEFLLKKNDVKVIKGKGKFIAPQIVDTEGERVEGDHVVIATGSESAEILGFDGKRVITSNEALAMEEFPSSMVVVGAGPIGVEFATFFSSFGVKVDLIEMMEHILPTLNDRKITDMLRISLKKRGIEIKTGSSIDEIEKSEEKIRAILGDGGSVEGEKALVSIGRKLNSSGIGLEGMEMKTEKGRIQVNERMETSVEGVYAIGDVTGGMMLAHKAMHEGIIAAENMAGEERDADYSIIPSVVYSNPEVAWVGMTKEEAQQENIKTMIGECPFSVNGKALCEGEVFGTAKVVADRRGRIIGSQIIGPQASILIEELALAMKMGANLEDISRLIHPHPTLGEVIFEACSRALGR